MQAEKLWYFVGLIASDGCLSNDQRHIDITAKEKKFLELLKQDLNLNCGIGQKTNGRGQIAYRLQFSCVSIYAFLKKCGLSPNKSKTLADLDIPDDHFSHFLRGVLDGDGCIRKWKSNKFKFVNRYVKITSGSEKFLIWINKKIHRLFNASGTIHLEQYKKSSAYILKISRKSHYQKVLRICYQNDWLALPRKRVQALEALYG
ncbi:MAG: LAGLIDADG family homing endonuclease [Deltaproteobacteria bacterium]|nr:LAGLIDADG family homing endonuclease [Deltaproteobacteria bacterium]